MPVLLCFASQKIYSFLIFIQIHCEHWERKPIQYLTSAIADGLDSDQYFNKSDAIIDSVEEALKFLTKS